MKKKRILHLSLGKRGVERDVEAEIRFHLEMRTQEFVDQGWEPAEARRAARASFGNLEAITAECRRIRTGGQRRRRAHEFATDLIGDFRFAARSLGRNPGFTLAILLTLALGIGANTAVFSLVNGVLIRPLPYAQGDELVHLRQTAAGAGLSSVGFSAVELADYRQQARTLETLVEYHDMNFTLLGLEEPTKVQTGVVSAEFFDMLGVEPLLGRVFLPGEDLPGADPVLVLSYEFWQRAFVGDPSVIGRKLEMNDRVHTVVGVLPSLPQYPEENDVYMPVSSCPFRSGERWSTQRDERALNVFGRLQPGVSLNDAREDLSRVASLLHAGNPTYYPESANVATTADPLREELVRRARPRLLVLLGITGFLLLIVIANVANLTLARLIRREREMAIRSAIGAGRGRLFRQMFSEAILLSFIGGAIALLLALGGLDLLRTFVARLTTRAAEVGIDRNVLIFTLSVSLAVGLVMSLLPLLPARVRLVQDLNDGNPLATASRGHLRTRSVLIASQVAVSFVLLVGAGLLIRSFVKLQGVDPGFDAENVLTVRIPLDWSNYREGRQVSAFVERLTARVEGISGVVSVATANKYPLSGQSPTEAQIAIQGEPAVVPKTTDRLDVQGVSPTYFATLGIPLLAGRTFGQHEPGDTAFEMILSETAARRLFLDADPLGRRVCWQDCEWWATVIAVAGDVKQYGLDSELDEIAYFPFTTHGWRDFRLLVRANVEPFELAQRIRTIVHEIEPTAPVTDVRTVSQARHESVSAPRLTMVLMGLFAALALAVTATGIGGIIAYSVSQRTRELGIRMALGADATALVRMVLRQALWMVAAGLVVGLPVAIGLSRYLEGFLFDTSIHDPFTFTGVSLALILVATAACLIPARRATSIDPMMILRTE